MSGTAPTIRHRSRLRRATVRAIACSAAVALTVTILGAVRGPDTPATDDVTEAAVTAAASRTNPITPRNFTGYGFDQCLAPTQKAMNVWHQHSPFLSVGIYISGNSRHCRHQPNLTPSWVATQLRRGWQLLPITLGPQASCATRYPKYRDDPTINPSSTRWYLAARTQARREAESAVAAAKALGIVEKSTLFYDLEGFNMGDRACKESALHFVSAWTTRLHQLNYKSGFYSSAGSGIKMLDEAKAAGRTFDYPDTLWIARWDGKANTRVSSEYLAPSAWLPGGRLKQYQGGHNETWGGVTINIDRNYLDLGRGSFARPESHCDGTRVNLYKYPVLRRPTANYTPPRVWVRAAQCLLQEAGHYDGRINGIYRASTRNAIYSWQTHTGRPRSTTFSRHDWQTLTSAGSRPVLKIGSSGKAVYRAQRALRAAMPDRIIAINGVFDPAMARHTKIYRERAGLASYGIFHANTWRRMQLGMN